MKHLSPLDFQLLLEGSAGSEMAQHLAVCELCRGELSAELRAECALSELGQHFAARDATNRGAGEWDEISIVRETDARRRPLPQLRSALAHTLCAGAISLLPWISFLSAPAPQPPTALSRVQSSRCVVMQPWCR